MTSAADTIPTTNDASVIWLGVIGVALTASTNTAATGRHTKRFQNKSGTFLVFWYTSRAPMTWPEPTRVVSPLALAYFAVLFGCQQAEASAEAPPVARSAAPATVEAPPQT